MIRTESPLALSRPGGSRLEVQLRELPHPVMSLDQMVTVVTSALLAALGWVIGYVTTVRRDRLSERRDLRVQYLLDAYRRLEGAANRQDPTEDDERALESAIADIQLLGSPEQVHRARQFALEFASTGQASLDRVLEGLRLELRKELALRPLLEGITFLRIVRNAKGRRRESE